MDFEFVKATHVGQKALWIVFWMFSIGFVLVSLMALRVEKKARLFHWYVFCFWSR